MKELMLAAAVCATACAMAAMAENTPDTAPAKDAAPTEAPGKALPEGWTDDFEAAKAQAAKEGKLLLVDFTGSDWCCWCIKLDEEVFSKKEFVEAAQKDFVLVQIDSPRDKSKLSKKVKKQNSKLIKKYGIKGFPSVLLMDAEGVKLAKTGYKKGGPAAYLPHLAEMKELAQKRASGASMVLEGWTDDFEAAKAQAAKDGKRILLHFFCRDGGDGGKNKALESDVLSKKEFQDEAKKDYALVQIDCSRDGEFLSKKVRKQNEELLKEYQKKASVYRYLCPLLLVVDADGNAFGQVGYQKDGPEKYLKLLAWAGKPEKEREAQADAFAKSIGGLEEGSSERLAKIDEFLDGIPEVVHDDREYRGLVLELVCNDRDGRFAKRFPKVAYVNPVECKFKATRRSLNGDFVLRALKMEEGSSAEEKKAVYNEYRAALTGRFDEIKKEIEEMKSKVPEIASEFDSVLREMEWETRFEKFEDDDFKSAVKWRSFLDDLMMR